MSSNKLDTINSLKPVGVANGFQKVSPYNKRLFAHPPQATRSNNRSTTVDKSQSRSALLSKLSPRYRPHTNLESNQKLNADGESVNSNRSNRIRSGQMIKSNSLKSMVSYRSASGSRVGLRRHNFETPGSRIKKALN